MTTHLTDSVTAELLAADAALDKLIAAKHEDARTRAAAARKLAAALERAAALLRQRAENSVSDDDAAEADVMLTRISRLIAGIEDLGWLPKAAHALKSVS